MCDVMVFYLGAILKLLKWKGLKSYVAFKQVLLRIWLIGIIILLSWLGLRRRKWERKMRQVID